MNNDTKLPEFGDIAMVSRRERYENMLKKSDSIRSQLLQANSEKQLQKVLEELEAFLRSTRQGVNMNQLSGCVSDLRGTITALRMGDSTRNELAELLNQMNQRIQQLIDAEKRNENIERLRAFFKDCAAHAGEIAEILGENNSLFG